MTRIDIMDDGPLLVRGEVTLTDGAGEAYVAKTLVSLCRCGLSETKPFCDGSHRPRGFRHKARRDEA